MPVASGTVPIAAGVRRHRVTLENPGTAVPDGDGGYTQVFTSLSPAAIWVSITPATARDLERVTAGTVLATASHIITGPYHAGVTTQTRITFKGRVFHVAGVANVDERNIEMQLVCVEVVT